MRQENNQPTLDLAPIASRHIGQILRQVWVIDLVKATLPDQVGDRLQPRRLVALKQRSQLTRLLRGAHNRHSCGSAALFPLYQPWYSRSSIALSCPAVRRTAFPQ